jgi:hypothetical protein
LVGGFSQGESEAAGRLGSDVEHGCVFVAVGVGEQQEVLDAGDGVGQVAIGSKISAMTTSL